MPIRVCAYAPVAQSGVGCVRGHYSPGITARTAGLRVRTVRWRRLLLLLALLVLVLVLLRGWVGHGGEPVIYALLRQLRSWAGIG